MIRALEEHLAAWMKDRLQELAAQSGLYGPVRTVAGDIDLPPAPPMAPGEVAVLVRVDRLTPAPENRDLAHAPVTESSALHMSALINVHILGEASVLAAAAGRDVKPAQAHLHRVDLVVMTLLSLMRERSGPTPDLAEPPELDAVQGEFPQGATSAAQGSRKAHFYWTALEPLDATVTPKNAKNQREWAIPVHAACTFRLSPAELSGGRMLQIAGEHEAVGAPDREVTIYAPAEAIPLDHFSGLSDQVLTELGELEISTLGHLGRLSVARVTEITTGLRTATAAEKTLLGQLAAADAARLERYEELRGVPMEPDALALPARALLLPTPGESAVLALVTGDPAIQTLVSQLAVPVAFALKTDRRETVKVGSLLSGRR
jgi:hypothetical protein